MTDEWGFADIYSMDAEETAATETLEDVHSDEWRNILVLGRATHDGVYAETLALVGRARYMADELGCRVEVLLIGEDLEPATQVLRKYPINTIYRVAGPGYAPIEMTGKILEAVVKKRRPELVMSFQSRTGDAVLAFAANRLRVGYVIGATQVDIDTSVRRARATHQATNTRFQIVTEFQHYPQFVSVQRGLFRAPMEDPYAAVQVHELDVDPGPIKEVEVIARGAPEEPTLEDAERVVIAGARIQDEEEMGLARQLAEKLDAVFGVTRSLVDRGLGGDDELVSETGTRVRPRLLVTVGVRGSLDVLDAIRGHPTVCAIGSEDDDPITRKAAYLVSGPVEEAAKAVLEAL